jgi:hypothetical protein
MVQGVEKMKARIFSPTVLPAVLALIVLAGCQSHENRVQGDWEGAKTSFVGTQKDYWCAVAPDRIRITSELTLRTRPDEAVIMPVRSPCPRAQLEAVTVKGQALDFRRTGRGVYDVNLPSDKQVQRQRQILFTWQVLLRELKYESGLYWTRPRSLIPVVLYELRAGAEPQSGFEVFGAAAKDRPVFYSWRFATPASEFGGQCALPLRPRHK